MLRKTAGQRFRVLEPVLGKINEQAKAPATLGSRLGLRPRTSDWFRIYRVCWFPFSYRVPFAHGRYQDFLPSECFDLIFLKAKIDILCTKGFEIMDLIE